jgi:hypothetical protein
MFHASNSDPSELLKKVDQGDKIALLQYLEMQAREGNLYRRPKDSRLYAKPEALPALNAAGVKTVPFPGDEAKLVHLGSLEKRLEQIQGTVDHRDHSPQVLTKLTEKLNDLRHPHRAPLTLG